jgi:hypothetical protein
MSLSTLTWVGSNFYKQRVFISVLGRIPKYKCICEDKNLKYLNIKDFDFSKGYNTISIKQDLKMTPLDR